MKFMIKLLLLVIVSFAIGCQSGNLGSDFPESCVDEGIEYVENNLVLKKGPSSSQSLYLIHNISDNSFLLNHPLTNNPGASAGWASEVSSGNWSSLTLNDNIENFAITCSTIGDGRVKYLKCKDVVKACRIENAAFNSGDSGSYWVAENRPLKDLLEAIRSRGIEVGE